MATDPVLAARSALGNAVRSGDTAAAREARAALIQAKITRLHEEFTALTASSGPGEHCCPRCTGDSLGRCP